MNATTAALIGAFVATVVSGLFALCSTWLQRRAEERRQIRELAVKVALENWKIAHEQRKGTKFEIFCDINSLNVYLINAMHLISALDGSLITPEQIRKHLRSGFAATNAAAAEIDDYNKQQIMERSRAAS